MFHHRFASADPLAVTFSGELLAMVIIGGMRSLLGPALGALFFILFREFLSIWTPDWLFSSAAVRGLRHLFADRTRRRCGAADSPVPGARDRTGRDGRPSGRRGFSAAASIGASD